MLVRVEDEPVGRTGRDGTLTAQVPSGPILVTAIIPPGQLGYESVTLPAGGAATVSLVLQSDAEPGDEIDLDLVETEDDVLQHTVKSFTLRFTRDDVAVPVTRIEEVRVLTPEGTTACYLDEGLFTIRNGAVVANDVARVLAALRAYAAPIVLRVSASDIDALVYSGTVAFRIELRGLFSRKHGRSRRRFFYPGTRRRRGPQALNRLITFHAVSLRRSSE